MQRILERGKIEAFAERAIPRLRRPDRGRVFAARAERLRELAREAAIGHSIADYLGLMADLADAQQAALERCAATPPNEDRIAHARRYKMPPIPAAGWPREPAWQEVLGQLCAALAAQPSLPQGVHETLDRLRRSTPDPLEQQADVLLAARSDEVDVAAAPFLVAALQVYWVDLAERLPPEAAGSLESPGVCPACGTLPVASIVRTEGYRYLHCALCATEWHLVRVTCSHCQATKGISYQSIEGGPEAIRAECCDECRTYRKILYQEKDPGVEPVADDLASLALDLLLAEAGYHRASGNPLLWQARQ